MPSDQFLVFFRDYPAIDIQAFAKYFKETDPDEAEDLEIQPLKEKVHPPDEKTRAAGLKDEPLKVSAFLLTLGEFNLSILIQNIKDPKQLAIDHSSLREDLKEKLRSHNAFALLTLTGGEQYKPTERVVFLAKTALGLCRQGAIGAACPEGLTAIDADTFNQMAEIMGENGSLWQALRSEGFPSVLYSNKLLMETEEGSWIVTFGHALLRLPDLAILLIDETPAFELARGLDEILRNMIRTGPAIQPGQVFNICQHQFVVSEPAENEEFWARENGTLLLREQPGRSNS